MFTQMFRRTVIVALLSACGPSDKTAAPQASPSCPTAAPTAGTPCSASDADQCEYGSNALSSCNVVIGCLNGSWVGARNACPFVDTQPAACPAAWSDITAGSSCSPGVCGYGEGTCVCPASDRVWHCIAAQPNCPSPRPALGSSCSGATECDYGRCVGGSGQVCRAGSWHSQGTICK